MIFLFIELFSLFLTLHVKFFAAQTFHQSFQHYNSFKFLWHLESFECILCCSNLKERSGNAEMVSNTKGSSAAIASVFMWLYVAWMYCNKNIICDFLGSFVRNLCTSCFVQYFSGLSSKSLRDDSRSGWSLHCRRSSKWVWEAGIAHVGIWNPWSYSWYRDDGKRNRKWISSRSGCDYSGSDASAYRSESPEHVRRQPDGHDCRYRADILLLWKQR